ncbi:DMT family transporter [Xylanibacillus composti]|uniref:EamA domain-containing protein n=1 Tax=Xylanibacillus composti TaxID=1572762 RepID=A0A8J4H2F1_9BACL|nr:DMT family transporter [Xylanibacillus composti]MDT9723583.1 DMT family transporter [Xylanibacillus composti]GIQ68380.1 hypothetical protein XYCOK13_12040 [Xylanibacillus composti]
MKNGIGFALLSTFVFSAMNALVKEASATIPAAEIAFFRGLIGTILILFFMQRSRISFSRNGVPMLFFRGAMGGFYMLAFFYTVAYMPLVDASILAQTSPVFVVLLSAIVLKERLSDKAKLFVPVILAGAMLVINPFQYSSFSWVALVGLSGALFAASASLSIRYLSRTHPAYEIVFYFVATSTIVAVPFMWNEFVVPDVRGALLLLAIGVVSLLGQLFLTKAFTHEHAAVVQVVSYAGLIMNALFGFIFWQEVPGWLAVAGGSLIVLGCIGLSTARKTGRIKERGLES